MRLRLQIWKMSPTRPSNLRAKRKFCLCCVKVHQMLLLWSCWQNQSTTFLQTKKTTEQGGEKQQPQQQKKDTFGYWYEHLTNQCKQSCHAETLKEWQQSSREICLQAQALATTTKMRWWLLHHWRRQVNCNAQWHTVEQETNERFQTYQKGGGNWLHWQQQCFVVRFVVVVVRLGHEIRIVAVSWVLDRPTLLFIVSPYSRRLDTSILTYILYFNIEFENPALRKKFSCGVTFKFLVFNC